MPQNKTKSQLGIIGGSGLYQIDGVEVIAEHDIKTPFGHPSDSIIEASIAERSVFFLPRHGKGHSVAPSEVPFKANIAALKNLGVTHILAISAVGIMNEQIKPGDMILPNQVIDMTKGIRDHTFFRKGVVGHSMFADPFCQQFRDLVFQAAEKNVNKAHKDGTYVCIEGPRFSTRAESHFYRKVMNPSCIGMTAMPEASLAREAEMSYALLGLATDYDCWHESEDDVTVEAVLAILKNNVDTAKNIIFELVKGFSESFPAPYRDSGRSMVVTNPEKIPTEANEILEYLYGSKM